MNNLTFRVLTALVAVPIILGLLYLLPWWAFGALAAAALCVAALEFFQLTHADDRLAQAVGLLVTLGVYVGQLVTEFGAEHPAWSVFVSLAVVPFALLFTLFRARDQGTALLRMASLSMAPLYIGGSIATIACLRRVEVTGHPHVGAGLVVLTLMIAWFSDTAGYFVGRSVKGPKLYPAVSPNKTWSGALGGLCGSALGALLAHFWFLRELPLREGLLVAVIAGAFGQAGDLCESLMKRAAGVKDSGGILPGHGGILDRLDAMMFVAPVLYVALRLRWLVLA